jgi:hypothetical protein
MKPTLGMKVYADKVYEWPSHDTWEDGATVELSPVDKQLKDEVAVIIGRERKRYKADISYYIYGDGSPFTGGSEGDTADTHSQKSRLS